MHAVEADKHAPELGKHCCAPSGSRRFGCGGLLCLCCTRALLLLHLCSTQLYGSTGCGGGRRGCPNCSTASRLVCWLRGWGQSSRSRGRGRGFCLGGLRVSMPGAHELGHLTHPLTHRQFLHLLSCCIFNTTCVSRHARHMSVKPGGTLLFCLYLILCMQPTPPCPAYFSVAPTGHHSKGPLCSPAHPPHPLHQRGKTSSPPAPGAYRVLRADMAACFCSPTSSKHNVIRQFHNKRVHISIT